MGDTYNTRPEPHINGTLAVVDTDGQWWLPGESDSMHLPGSTPAELLETARTLEIGQVWILPGGPPAPLLDFDDWRVRVTGNAGAGSWSWCYSGPAEIEVCQVPQDPRRMIWAGLGPLELLVELVTFQTALRARWHWSGAITSDSWLRTHYRARGGLRLDRSDVVDVPVATKMLHWARPPGPRDLQGAPAGSTWWVHSFDVNGMFLAAASSLPLPVGPARSVRYGAKAAWDPAVLKLPGLWRLAGLEEWVPTPTLELELERGLGLAEIAEGRVWPENHRWLEPWYRALRDARASTLLDGAPVARRALKQVYTAGVGRLGSARRAQGENDPLYQPYWRHAVIAEANARLARKLANPLTPPPIALDVDRCWWISPDPDPASFAAGAGLHVSDQLGKWKHSSTVPYTPELANTLRNPLAHQVIETLRANPVSDTGNPG